MKHRYLVPATLFACGARNIRNSAPRINNERKHLRRSPDPKPRRVIPKKTIPVSYTHLTLPTNREV